MLALLGLATVAAAGGLTAADAHYDTLTYYNIHVAVTEYERTAYNGYDLVRIKLSIENLENYPMWRPSFVLGGHPEYVDDPTDNPDTAIGAAYPDVTYADVRGRGGDVSVHDCTSADRWSLIPENGSGEASMCFMVGKAFQPDGIMISQQHSVETDPNHDRYWTRLGMDQCAGHSTQNQHHPCRTHVQVIPFTTESVYCFDHNFEYCNADNVQPIGDTVVTRPAPEPEPAKPAQATLLYSIYNNGTGTLTLVFSELVVAHNPDRIDLIHDIDAYVDNGTAPDLGDAELMTVDNKRQSTILAFALADEMRLEVAESLQEHGDLALLISPRAIYAADGFTDVTERHDAGAILVTDLVAVR